MITCLAGKSRGDFFWFLLVVPLLLGAAPAQEKDISSPCAVGKEIAIKGVFLFDHQKKMGLEALKKAYKTCPSEFGIPFNLGLAYYQSGNLKQAERIWGELYATYPNHEKTLANLAWVKFELGEDNEATKLATKGLDANPMSWPLTHTKVFSLFRQGRYLETYDWLSRIPLSGIRADKWRAQAASYVAEIEWRKFRKNQKINAIKQAVNLLVRWYPTEPIFIEAKDRLLLSYLNTEVSAPYPIALPHESWEKTGNVDDQSFILDDHINILPPIARWEKRNDAYAVIFGISQYKQLRAKPFANRDAVNMKSLLVGRGPFMDDMDHVRSRMDEEATLEALKADIQWLVRHAELNSNALLVFYFSGLGVAWPDGKNGHMKDALLIPVGVGMNDLNPQKTFSLAALKQKLEPLPNRNIIIILDSCFNKTKACAVYGTGGSAGFGARNVVNKKGVANAKPKKVASPIQNFFRSRHAWIVAAIDQEVKLYSPGRQGGLTYFMLKGMLGKGDGADGTPEDGWVDLAESFAFAKKQMQSPTSDLFLSRPAKVRLTKTAGEK